MNWEEVEQAMLQAIKASGGKEEKRTVIFDVEKARAERAEATKAYREQFAKETKLVHEYTYTCTVCGSFTDYETVVKNCHLKLMDAECDVAHPFKLTRFGSRFIVEDGKPVMQGNPPFVVCSNECRLAWIQQNWHTNRSVLRWLGHATVVPQKVRIPVTLDELNSEAKDEANTTNKAALAAIKKLMNGDKGFYLFGDSGCGKTTIAAYLANQYMLQEKTVRWVTYNEMQEALEMKFANQKLAGFVYRLVDAEYDNVTYRANPWDVVILDDLSNDFTPGSIQQSRLKRLFSQWYEADCTLIITSNVDAEVMGNAIGGMVTSRLLEIVNRIPFPKVDFREQQ